MGPIKAMALAADKKYKVVMLGDSTVGKSSILYRLKFSSFSGKQESTIGCEFFAKPIPIPERPDNPVKLLIWDTAGQEVFRSFTPNFLRGALAGIICYDHTSDPLCPQSHSPSAHSSLCMGRGRWGG